MLRDTVADSVRDLRVYYILMFSIRKSEIDSEETYCTCPCELCYAKQYHHIKCTYEALGGW